MKVKTLFCSCLLLLGGWGVMAADNKAGINYYRSGLCDIAKGYFLRHCVDIPDELQAERYFYLGECYLMGGQVDSAQYYYQKGVSQNPDYPYNYIGLGKLKLKADVSAATVFFDQAFSIKGYKKDADLYAALVWAYNYADDEGNARKSMELGRKYDGSNAVSFLAEGDMLLKKHQFGDAAARYDMAVYYDPSCVAAYIKLARLYEKTNRATAFEKLGRALEVVPEFNGTYYVLGELYQSAGDYGKAIGAYEKFMADGCYTPESLLHYASCFYFTGVYDRCLLLLKSVLSAEPSNVVAKRLYAYCVVKGGDGNSGLRAMEDFMATVVAKERIAQDYICYAEVLAGDRQYDKAVIQYGEALKLDDKRSVLYRDIADIYVRKRDFRNALDCYKRYSCTLKVLEAEDMLRLGKCYYNIGSGDTVLASRLEALHQADSLFRLLCERVPDSYIGYFWRARTNSLLDPESVEGAAKPFYEKIIGVVSGKPERYVAELVESYKYLGYYYYVKGDSQEAKQFFAKVLELAPNDEVAIKALKEIR